MNNPTEVANEILKIMNTDSSSKNFFQKDIEWIENRKAYWKSNRFKVGVLGITSSGKTTLLNALIGHKLLPTGVAPTSGVLVSCMKSDKFKVDIYYENNNRETITILHKAINQLKLLADEKYNPGNTKGVKDIYIYSPHFIPSVEGLIIIDSPGLNAYNLDRHEKLTLQGLLSDIELCVFVTVTKAGSDRDDRDIIEKIDETNRDYNKPVLVVQNKLNAVEAKISRNSKLEKTKEEVALEHLDRIKRVTANLINTEVDFCQISANDAEEGRVEKYNKIARFINKKSRQKIKDSRIDIFTSKIESLMNKEMERLKGKRLLQLENRKNIIIQDIRSKLLILRNEYAEIENAEAQISKLTEKYKMKYDDFENTINEINKENIEIESIYSKFEIDLRDIPDMEITKGERLIRNLRNDIDNKKDLMSDKFRDFENKLKRFMSSEFNLNYQESQNILEHADTSIDIKVIPTKKIKYEVQKSRKEYVPVKKTSGIFGGNLARWFGKKFKNDWGYKYVLEDVLYNETIPGEILNKKEITNQIEKNLTLIINKNSQAIENWKKKHLNILQKNIFPEIHNREKDFEIKKCAIIRPDLLSKIELELTSIKIIDFTCPIIPDQKPNQTETDKYSDIMKSRSITKFLVDIFEISQLVPFYYHTVFWEELLKINKSNHQSIKNILIYGWNTDSIIEFCERIILSMNKYEEDFKNLGLMTMNKNGSKILCVDSGREKNEFNNKKVKDFLNNENYLLFTILDSSQVGYQKSKISNDKIFKEACNNADSAYWIYQHFENEISSGDIEDGLNQFFELSERIRKKGFFMVNHSNPIYNFILRDIQVLNQFTQSDRTDISESIINNYPFFYGEMEKQNVSKIFNSWSNFLTKNNNYYGKQ